MFKELTPLLANRTVLITVARETDTTVRAVVIPKRTSESEHTALTTPLSFVGTAEELDEEFPRALGEYVETHQRLSTTLAQAKAEMDAAAKAAQDEAKRKSEERRKAKSTSSTSPSPGSPQAAGATNADPAPPASANLFGGAPDPAGQAQPGGKLCL
jgi:PRTRC genetic system protein E